MRDGTDAVGLQNLPPAKTLTQIACASEEEKDEAERDVGMLTAWHNDSYPGSA